MSVPHFDSDGLGHEFIDHLLASGAMVPAQLPSPSNWSPERKLAGAVLVSALMEVRDRHSDPAYRRAVSEDLDWISSDDTGWPYSFVPLCHVFGLEPEYVRDVVNRWLETERAPQRQVSLHRQAA